jgi:acetolactate synthase-1/2/3 large subunit
MGFALPAAIGAYYTNHKPVYCISGDGAFQMNIQELEWVVREHLPIKILIMNNQVLGLIRQSQAMYFDERYEGSVKECNYQPVSFCNIAKAYGIQSIETDDLKKINNLNNYLSSADPLIIELHLPENTVAIPKWKLGESIYNLTPFLDPNLLTHLITL